MCLLEFLLKVLLLIKEFFQVPFVFEFSVGRLWLCLLLVGKLAILFIYVIAGIYVELGILDDKFVWEVDKLLV